MFVLFHMDEVLYASASKEALVHLKGRLLNKLPSTDKSSVIFSEWKPAEIDARVTFQIFGSHSIDVKLSSRIAARSHLHAQELLHKSLYGLGQAPREWWLKLTQTLKEVQSFTCRLCFPLLQHQ